jgi:CubicO group peptidase (beta-lactamase class C family)
MKMIPPHTLNFIDSWLTLRSKWDDAPGFAVAIMKDGELVFNHAYGLANIETKEPMTTEHVFRIASQSKPITATAIMQLQEAGKLRIDDQVVTNLPWLKDHHDTRWQEVTIRQLLSHGAGVIRDGLDSDYWELRRDFPDANELKQAILEADLVLEPNTQMKYSNYGYSLLGQIIESVTGSSYADYVTTHITGPLELSALPDYAPDLVMATGYSRLNIVKDRLAFPHVKTNAMTSATGFCATASEIAKFYDGLRPGTGKLINDASKKEMQRVQWNVKSEQGTTYGLGLESVKRRQRTLVGHSGGFPGFVSRTWCDPEDGLVVAVITNSHGTRPGLWANAIIDLIDEFGDEMPKADLLKYEVRLGGMHGTGQVVAHHGGLRFMFVNSWWPLDQMETLEVVDDTTLKIVKSGEFSSQGELIRYTFNGDGSVHHVIDSGHYRAPTDDGDMLATWM